MLNARLTDLSRIPSDVKKNLFFVRVPLITRCHRLNPCPNADVEIVPGQGKQFMLPSKPSLATLQLQQE